MRAVQLKFQLKIKPKAFCSWEPEDRETRAATDTKKKTARHGEPRFCLMLCPDSS